MRLCRCREAAAVAVLLAFGGRVKTFPLSVSQEVETPGGVQPGGSAQSSSLTSTGSGVI